MKPKDKNLTNLTVAFRISQKTKWYYEALADKERRTLSQVLRLVLEDHEKGLCCKNGRKSLGSTGYGGKFKPVI